jgi:mRNA interferase MazF
MEIGFQYEIVLVNLDPTVGSEIKKTRPCVIISPNEMNQYLNTLIIAPLNNSLKNYPTRLIIQHSEITGSIAIDQIRTIDKTRIVKSLGTLTPTDRVKIKKIIQETLVN